MPLFRPPSLLLRSALMLTALASGLIACSDSEDVATDVPTGSAAVDTTAATTDVSSSTTVKSTTTTSQPTTTDAPDSVGSPTRPTIVATTTTLVPDPVYPLTGVANPDPVIAARPALVVKIDNAPGARPQTGFNSADIVYEEIVNDNLTRFAMVFQSQNSNPVGPIRSGRLQDVDLFTAYDHPLFAWSGGNRTVTQAIDASELVNIGPNRAAVYFRRGCCTPHNLYSNTDALWTQTPVYAPPARQQFKYRQPGAAAAGTPSQGVAVTLDSINVRWDWDPATGLYMRMMEGRAHNDAASGQVSTNNVVVLAVNYRPGISGSPDAETIGQGELFVFTGGNYIHGRWYRADIHDPFTLTADGGKPILLEPGRTFVELPRPVNTLALPPA